MERLKKVLGGIAMVLGFGLWVVACPEVSQGRDQNGCYEATKYAAVYEIRERIPCQ